MPLLPRALRLPAAILLMVCVVVTAFLGVHFAGYDQPGWLDSVVDPRVQADLGRFPSLCGWLTELGDPGPVTVMTAALALACAAVRRWRGAILAAVAAPVASGLTEDVLKPVIGRTLHGGLSFPSGHATATFALAGVCALLLIDPPCRRVPGTVRLLLALLGLLLASAVAAALVAEDLHYFTDAVGGAAVGIGVVLACTLALDLVVSRARPGQTARPAPDA